MSLERHRDRRTIHAHLALVLEIALVGDDDDGERVLVLHSEDLLVEGRDLFKRVARGNRIDEQEAFPCTHVLLTHRTVSFMIVIVEMNVRGSVSLNDLEARARRRADSSQA